MKINGQLMAPRLFDREHVKGAVLDERRRFFVERHIPDDSAGVDDGDARGTSAFRVELGDEPPAPEPFSKPAFNAPPDPEERRVPGLLWVFAELLIERAPPRERHGDGAPAFASLFRLR